MVGLLAAALLLAGLGISIREEERCREQTGCRAEVDVLLADRDVLGEVGQDLGQTVGVGRGEVLATRRLGDSLQGTFVDDEEVATTQRPAARTAEVARPRLETAVLVARARHLRRVRRAEADRIDPHSSRRGLLRGLRRR